MVEGKSGTKPFDMQEAYRDGCLDGDVTSATVLSLHYNLKSLILCCVARSRLHLST